MVAGKKPVTNSDCILSANGYKSPIVVPVISIDYGLSIVATQDTGRFNNIFYPMKAQRDTFSVSAVFASKAGTNFFNRWIWEYVEFACAPGSAIAVGLRVQMPSRNFDMTGFPTSGWSFHFAPVALEDVVWVITIAFDGAARSQAQVWAPPTSQFGPIVHPANPNEALSYPSYYGPGNTGIGLPTGSDAEYTLPKGAKNPQA